MVVIKQDDFGSQYDVPIRVQSNRFCDCQSSVRFHVNSRDMDIGCARIAEKQKALQDS